MVFYTPVSPDFYFILALTFTVIGIASFFWMMFFLETSRDLSNKDRVIGLLFRLILFSLTGGAALVFINLVGLFVPVT